MGSVPLNLDIDPTDVQVTPNGMGPLPDWSNNKTPLGYTFSDQLGENKLRSSHAGQALIHLSTHRAILDLTSDHGGFHGDCDEPGYSVRIFIPSPINYNAHVMVLI
jgi:hypothetical protein